MKNMRSGVLVVSALATATGLGLFAWWLSRRRGRGVYKSRIRSSVVPVDRHRVYIVTNIQEWNEVYDHLSHDLLQYKAVGLDCEWVNTEHQRNRPVSVLQLGSSSGLCVLIRGSLLRQCPESLAQLLRDKSVLKVGVACLYDARKLYQDYGITVRGCVDLRHVAVRSRLSNIGGLAALAKAVLGVHLDKDSHVRVGNWEAENLSERQIIYAATDAAVGLEIFLSMIEQKYFSLPARKDFWQTATAMCQGIVDIGFSNRRNNEELKDTKSGPNRKGTSVFKPVGRAYSTRRRPLYQNCQLQAPDGQLLSTCDEKKLLWYMEKGLGEKVSDEPLTVQLLFEPSGRPMEERNYYLQDKENMCVVCGEEESYIRKNIVPHEYRKYFPPMMKEHKSHDIVLMCLSCHQQSSARDAGIKQELEIQCDAPCSTENGRKYHDDRDLVKVRSAAKALYLSGAKLPTARKAELLQIVQGYFGVDDITDEMLKEASAIDPKMMNCTFEPHGQKVVQYMMEQGGLVNFEKRWRQHFLDSMQPQHLPPLWSVDHCHEELQSLDNVMKQVIAESSHTREDFKLKVIQHHNYNIS